jgi:diguanylate cyclase (GGDEF)-like protein
MRVPRHMAPEFISATCILVATTCAALWLRTRQRLCECIREREELANSSLVTDLEKQLLELVARGTPLQRLLDNVTGAIEKMEPGCVCTVLLLDEEYGRFLLSGSAPSLPPEYMRAVNGIEIGPEVGACGSAAFRNQTVIVDDIASDSRFADAKDFVLSFGLQACWSVPIRNFNNTVLGTFAMYHRKKARPLPSELRLVEAGARLAGNVIERLRSEQRLRDNSQRLDLAEKAAGFGIWEVNASSGAVAVSAGFATLIGLPAVSCKFSLGELETMLHPDDRAPVRAAAELAIKTGVFQAEFRIVLPDGSIRWERSQGRVELLNGGAKRATGAMIDITEERNLLLRLEQARMAAEASASAAQEAERLEQDRKIVLELVAKDQPLDQIALAIARSVSNHLPSSSCSLQLDVVDAGRLSASTLFPDEAARALALVPIESICETLSAEPASALSLSPEWQRYVVGDGGLLQQNYLAAPIFQNGLAAGMIVALLPRERVVTAAEGALLESWARFASLAIERRGLYEQLSFKAQYDKLTMLLNRASFYERMDARIAGAIQDGAGMAVLYIDLDSFKEINDDFGHAAGDAVLRSVSRRILRSIRRTDDAFRIGGDEFVVMLPDVCDRSEATLVAELIGRNVSEPIKFEGRELRIESSTGIAIFPEDGCQTDVLLKMADEDMYRLKLTRRTQRLRRISQRTPFLDLKSAPETAADLRPSAIGP